MKTLSFGVNDLQGIPLKRVGKTRVVIERKGAIAGKRNGTAAKANTIEK
jgi:hypothetical protein